MCGICGFTSYGKKTDHSAELLDRMTASLILRGPDDRGVFCGESVYLGHRRLSIIDLKNGHQPMFNESKTKIIVFNGEIYNYRELREKLRAKGHHFSTNSDTEVIIHSYEDKKERCLEDLNGMFAFAIYDIEQNELFMARDRFGEKPVYYSVIGKDIVFASEIKAMLHHPDILTNIDRTSLCRYLIYEYIPAPHTIYEKIYKLEAGQYLIWKDGEIKIRRYWDYGVSGKHDESCEEDVADRLMELLETSVKNRLISDVPLGVFLSGGIDSSAILALMRKNRPRESIKTFSISFNETSFDESKYARDMASYFKTDHYERVFTAEDMLVCMDDILGYMDEPLADASLLPTYLLSKFAREHVTVVLGGDGGDELFGGYPTFQALKLNGIYDMIPKVIADNIIRPWADRIPVNHRNFSFDFKVKKFIDGAYVKDLQIKNQNWLGAFKTEEIEDAFLNGGTLSQDHYSKLLYDSSKFSDDTNYLSYLYVKNYLQDDILTKTDRASMANSLEVRLPFLDVDLAGFISGLPGNMKVRGWTTKYIFKKALVGIIPKRIINRKKKGFGVPIARWFCHELKDRVSDPSFSRTLEEYGFRRAYIDRIVKEHWAHKKNHRQKLWALFALIKWHQSRKENFYNLKNG